MLTSRLEIHAGGHRLTTQRLEPDGAPSAPVLVFLHEGLGSIAQWRDFPTAMAESTGLPALLYERWGHGASDGLEGPRQARYLHDEALVTLPEVLRQCGVQDCTLMGHSDGGSIALIYAGDAAARRGVRLRGVIMEAAHVFVEEKSIEGIRATVRSYESGVLKQRLTRYHGVNTESMFRGWADAWLSPEFRNFNIEEYLPRMECPLLAIQGAEDEYGTPAQLAAIAAGAGGPVETALISACGHTPHLQARDTILALCREWILKFRT